MATGLMSEIGSATGKWWIDNVDWQQGGVVGYDCLGRAISCINEHLYPQLQLPQQQRLLLVLPLLCLLAVRSALRIWPERQGTTTRPSGRSNSATIGAILSSPQLWCPP